MPRRSDENDSAHREGKTPKDLTRLDSAARKRMVEDFLAWRADGNGEAPLGRPRKMGAERRRLWAKRLFDERLSRWGLQLDDLQAKKVRECFVKLSHRLPESSLHAFLQTAELISIAEEAKAVWNPKATREHYTRLSRIAISSAALAEEIAKIFPSPWKEQRAPIGALVEGLACLTKGMLMASTRAYRDRYLKTKKVRKTLKCVRSLLIQKTGRTRWDLLRDLVWLASGKKGNGASERTIRRYLEDSGRLPIPEKDYWNTHWNDLVMIEKLAPTTNYEAFESEALRYLRF